MKKLDLIQWIATGFVLAMQAALNVGVATWIVVVLSVCSSITWVTCAIMMKSKQLIVTNAACLACGIIGVVRIFS